MDSIYIWILFVGLCTICAIGLWYKDWELETFQVPLHFLSNSHTLEWVRSPLDKAARLGNTCGIRDRFADEEIKDAFVELVDPTCESGLPHTVGTHQIRIPISVWNANSAEWRAAVLRHERIHLQQRRNPERWAAFYEKEWGYTNHTEPPAELRDAAIRANPDTYPDRWACWRGRYWFVPLYRSKTAPKLAETDLRIWDSQQKTWLDQTPYEWRTQFCSEQGVCPYQAEHPAEISAEYATEWVRWTTPAAMQLRAFLGV
jgi:hypothetical protein